MEDRRQREANALLLLANDQVFWLVEQGTWEVSPDLYKMLSAGLEQRAAQRTPLDRGGKKMSLKYFMSRNDKLGVEVH